MWPLITQEYFDLTDQWPWEEDKFVKSLQSERGMPNAQSKGYQKSQFLSA